MKRSPFVKNENYPFGALFSSALGAILLLYFIFGFCFSVQAASCPDGTNTTLLEQLGRNRFCIGTDTARFQANYTGGSGFPTYTFFWDADIDNLVDPGENITLDLQNGSTLDGVIWTTDTRDGQRLKVLVQVPGCADYVAQMPTLTNTNNCSSQIETSCICQDNATTPGNGQFLDIIKITGLINQRWTVIAASGAYETSSLAPPAAPSLIPIGTQLTTSAGMPRMYRIGVKHVDGQPYSLTVSNGQTQFTITNGCIYPHPVLNIADSYCVNYPPFTATLTDAVIPASATTITANGVPITTFDPSLYAPGSTVTIAYAFDGSATSGYNPGCNVTGSQEVSIHREAEALGCHDVNLSISELGYSVLSPDMFIDGVPCQSSFDLMVMGHDNTMTCADLGKTFRVMVVGYNLGCSAWVTIEDKLPPTFVCEDVTVACGTNIWEASLEDFITVRDNCSDDVTVTLIDEQLFDVQCNPNYSAYVTRSYAAVDDFGRQSTCSHTIYFAKGNISSIVFPADITLDCSNPNTSITATGSPTLDGSTIRGFCEFYTTYVDVNVTACCGSVLKRMWTVRDVCTGTVRSQVQNIRFSDTQAPTIACPVNSTISADVSVCSATYTFPNLAISDNCARLQDIQTIRYVNGLAVFTNTYPLPVGDNTISYYAIDCCYNVGLCSYTVRVVDNTSPNMVCNGTQASICLDDSGIAVFPYRLIGGNFFTDNCGIRDTAIAMMGGEFGSEVTFTCANVGPQMISIRVRDISGNANYCMVRVLVIDKSIPIVSCPADFTLGCEAIGPNLSTVFPGASITSLCPNALTTNLTFNSSLNACNVGTVTFNFAAVNISTNISATCSTRGTFINRNPITSGDIVWPLDFSTNGCTLDTTRATRGIPTINGLHCIPPGINSTDIFRSTDLSNGCYIFIRRWTVTDPCTGATFGHDQSISAPNAGTPRILASNDITASTSISTCTALVVIPSPTIFNCGNSPTITNSYNNQGANISAIFPLGSTTITYTARNACGHTATDVMVVTVRDNTRPFIFNCPANVNLACGANIFPLSQYGAPIITDNCGTPVVVSRVLYDTTQCGQGTVTRIWAATDNGVDTVRCIQTISRSGTIFTSSNITWPADASFSCAQNISFGVPTFSNVGCSRLSINFADVTLSTAGSGCLRIQRTWTVRDTCQLVTGTNNGIFTDIQIIEKSPSGVPTLTVPGNMITIASATLGGNCTALVTLNPATSTNCGGSVTITHNSPYAFNTTGANASGIYPVGVHFVTFTATNACGSNSSIVTVTVRDLTSPQIICPLDLTINCDGDLQSAINTQIAQVSSIDNCTLQDLTVSQSSNISCNGGRAILTFSIRDQSNNTASCQSTIVVLPPTTAFDPNNIMWPSTPLNINCQENYDPTTLGSVPTIPQSACRDVSVSYQDVTISPSNPSICKERIRTWRISVPCSGDYTFAQDIQIRDNDVPVFSGLSAEVNVTALPGACTAFVDLSDLTVTDCNMVSVSHNSTWATLGTNNIDASGFYPVGGGLKILYNAVDMCGNTAQFHLKLTVRNNGCPAFRTLGGVVRSDNGLLMDGVNVNVNNFDPVTTDVRGYFYLRNVPEFADYRISGHKTNNVLNGVSTFDLLKIQRHILGITPLPNQYKMIAADIDKSGSINALDLIDLKKVILGINSQFTNNESWRFIPSNMDLSAYTNFLSMPELNQYTLENLRLDHSRLDFIGIKIGDINGNATVNLNGVDERSNNPSAHLVVPSTELISGQEYQIPVYLDGSSTTFGLQGELALNSAFGKILEIIPNTLYPLTKDQFVINVGNKQSVRFSIAQGKSWPVSSEIPLFYIKVKALQNSNLDEILSMDEQFLQGQFYTNSENILKLDLDFRNNGKSTNGNSVILGQNSPNPFSESTEIPFYLPKGDNINFAIYNTNGAVLYNLDGYYPMGWHTIQLPSLDLKANTVLFYSLKCGDFLDQKKMIFMKP
jgi:hypothetical protein